MYNVKGQMSNVVSVPTHGIGVWVRVLHGSSPAWLTIKTLSVKKKTRNHLTKSFFVEKTRCFASGLCSTPSRVRYAARTGRGLVALLSLHTLKFVAYSTPSFPDVRDNALGFLLGSEFPLSRSQLLSSPLVLFPNG